MLRAAEGKRRSSDFFGSKVTLLARDDAPHERLRELKDKLARLDFDFEVVRCDQRRTFVIYHRGDLISGFRLQHFFDYASWLRNR
jgi:hypothetical protein